jgi:hypothetical protein
MPPPLPEKSSGWGEKGNLPLAQESQVSRSGAVQEGRMPYINKDEDDNAGPTSEYRFPTASSRGHRPDSVSICVLNGLKTSLGEVLTIRPIDIII